MGVHSVSTNQRRLAIQAGTAELRIRRIELTNTDSVPHDVEIRRYSSPTISGGTPAPTAPLREVGLPSTATAEAATNLSVTGTADQFPAVRVPANSSVTYRFPGALTVAPGSALVLEADTTGTQVRSGVFYEE